MKIYEVIQTKNPSYILGRPMTPIGILVHSTGAANNTLKRYVDAPAVLGNNLYGNHWNQAKATKSMHGFIGLDILNGVAVAYTLPYNVACWGVGSGPKGSYNRDPVGHIQFEVCEDSAAFSGKPPTEAQKAYYKAAWKTVEDYCVYLCKKFGFSAKNITCHYEAYSAGYGSNHGDPRPWMKIFGDSMDQLRARVAARLVSTTPEPADPGQTYTIRVQFTTEENARLAGVPVGTIQEYDFEEYVATVVASEIGNAPLEAAKAQAITGRTFAWPNVLRNSAILDTSPSQAFRLSRYHNNSYEAAYEGARQTRGLTVNYNGYTVPNIYYADSNGGVMLATSEKWGKQYMPWQLHKDDPWDYAVSKGKVNGHQVGMSQVGAVYAAQLGKTVTEILAFYYPNTVIAQATKGLATFTTPPPALPALYLARVNTKLATGLYLWTSPKKTKTVLSKPIPKGTTVIVLSAPTSGFVQARYLDKEGYIDNQYLVKMADIPPINPAPPPDTKVVKTKLGAGIGIWSDTKKTKRFIQIPDGTVVKILSVVNTQWAHVEYKTYKGYCDRNYLR